ncbi:hypothetical protein CLUG_04253 [Clavispora lusitaniae ATCC 42720]|uniref:Transcription factor MBP1 n=1 Tax=Clavispora lusitaniae (strain ATCC 42720) TaxID=306902 RepID=C4Y7S5_CLAL4|nr:uncharacterized protein CLUG_04253 [Clavispora lusitaniae ATCC 42720]EEQ40125.1 hypothetical protein CLUG_04253 [Clavispora lusitaniae ATCC 42720]KAF5209878.1 hypothetical protein E0198_004195 [Clavispora lusitaniae]
MSANPNQIYSATYSNVPVFEFVTKEGPIMRRKSDSWINATHILKIAKFPKAKRTRILEKDVQTGIHEKVQGGYGKYQGTYVPLDLGAEIAKSFGIFEELRPIFEFQYVEGKSATPPPAPKHSHASASNVSRRQYLQQQKQQRLEQSFEEDEQTSKRMKPSASEGTEVPKKRGRPKRVALTGRGKPDLRQSQTTPIDSKGPSMGTFGARQESSFGSFSQMQLPPLMRQDTEKDAIQFMANNLNLKNEDLEPEASDDDDDKVDVNNEGRNRKKRSADYALKDTDEDELMTGRELFGSRDSMAASRDSFDKIVQMHSRNSKNMNMHNIPKMLSLNGSISGDTYGLAPFHHQNQYSAQVNSSHIRGDQESVDYFNTLLNFFLEDDSSDADGEHKDRNSTLDLPERILNPPQPLSKINISQPIDNEGNTIFHWACSMANVAMVEFLLSIFSNFIDSEAKNYHGETPLMFMTKFNNSYQLNNFPTILDLLFDSVLSVDNYGRTVLHHIALACKTSKRDLPSTTAEQDTQKERFAKYYMEVLFSKIVEFPEFQLSQGNQNGNSNDKKELISKFLNHQDNEGNTAFHIAAYNMSKKLVKTFIKYHMYLNLKLRNLVNCSVEDYLASHNYVLRLDNGSENLVPTQEDARLSEFAVETTQSFEAQLHKSKLANNLQNSTANLVTQKLTELAYVVDKELSEKDEKLLALFRFSKLIAFEKFNSQKSILDIFNLGYLVEDVEKDFETTEEDIQSKSDSLVIDGSRDVIIQDEINRLQNDMMFQYLATKEEFSDAFKNYVNIREKVIASTLTKYEKESVVKEESTNKEKLQYAIDLQKAIIQRKEITSLLYNEEIKAPVAVQNPEEFKENQDSKRESPSDTTEEKDDAETQNHEDTTSTIATFPHDDKLYKYCKLISLSCGMTFAEVESSIDLIEQSLSRGTSNV